MNDGMDERKGRGEKRRGGREEKREGEERRSFTAREGGGKVREGVNGCDKKGSFCFCRDFVVLVWMYGWMDG